jgi:DNA-binding transcriptional LysR family regulator
MDKDFDLNLLRVLVAPDRERSVTRAASATDMSQSGFSTALARLRERTGDPLFVRTRTGMQATPRASERVIRARAILDDVQASLLGETHFDPAGAPVELRLAMAHHLGLPAIVAETDPIATVPLTTATYFTRTGSLQVLPVPFPPPRFDVQQYWHRRTHHDVRVRWLQQQIAQVFNDSTDPWQAVEDELYGTQRKRL